MAEKLAATTDKTVPSIVNLLAVPRVDHWL
jgi:hypothetical protein